MVKSSLEVVQINYLECQVPNQISTKIDLSERSRKIVEEIARQRSTEYRLVIRALIMLAMADGLGNNELARKQQMDRAVVRKWRNRWLDLSAKLKNVEASEISDEHLRDMILSGLSDLPRSGTPPKFTAEQIVQIIAVSCEDPTKSERPVSHWTPSELADEVVKRKIVETISPASVWRFLKSGHDKAAFG
jgi:putative transposase